MARELAPAGGEAPQTGQHGVPERSRRLGYDCFAAEREQAPSPRGIACYSVSVSLFTNAPGNNIEAVARWL